MKKVILIVLATVILCTVMITGSAYAKTLDECGEKIVYFTHHGNVHDECEIGLSTARTTGLMRELYNVCEFSSICCNGCRSFDFVDYDLGFCEACMSARCGGILPEPAEE